MRPTPSNSSFAASGGETATAHASAAIFRTLVFGGSVPIEVVLAGGELLPGVDRSIEAYYLQAPRISYLPLVLAQVRKYFLDLVLDDNSAASLRAEELWFEADGVPLKWHWPIGLLYDYHHLSTLSSLLPPPPTAPSTSADPSSALPNSLASVFAPLSSPSPSAADLSFPSSDLSPNATLRAPPSTTARPRTPSSARSLAPAPEAAGAPWRVTLHLRDPPGEALLVSNRVEDARAGFMAMVKEADYVRWGNTKRVTNLRKEQQDNLWEGVVQNDFDKYWHVASKLVPLPSLSSSSSSASRSPTPSSTSSTFATGGDGRLPDANAVRSVPMRVYLPEGGGAVMDVVAPVQTDGSPTTLHDALSSLLPLLFPPPPTSTTSSSSAPAAPAPLAHALVQGVYVPLSAEVGWLGACLAGADGWVGVVLVLEER
ncbi:autophagy protein 5 [Rhodotorula kratochvilovae]